MAEVPISRPTPPRPEDYVVVPGSQGPRRDFRISVGLLEGWDAEAQVFDVSEAVRSAFNPTFTISRFRAGAGSHNPTYLVQRERACDGMRMAGVPEQ